MNRRRRGRSAVAATIASVIVFTTMLVANAVLFSSQNNLLPASQEYSAQVAERGMAGVVPSLAAYEALDHVQSYLQQNPMDCSSGPAPYLDRLAGTWSASGNQQGIEFSSSSSWGYDATAGRTADTSPASPLGVDFDGFSAGSLNVLVTTLLNESYYHTGGLPTYSAQTSEVVHLPVEPVLEAERCQTALSELGAVVATLQDCNESSLLALVVNATGELPLLDGYRVNATIDGQGSNATSAAPPSAPTCLVSYSVTTTLLGIPGVAGTFQWTLSGSASLLVSVADGPLSNPS